MAILKIYSGSPTAGGTNGTVVSEGTQSAPITASLVTTASDAATAAVKLALRCDTGYQTTGNTTLKFVDSSGADYTSSNYKLANDSGYASPDIALSNATWLDSLTLTATIGATNTIFWIKLSAPAGSSPVNDTSISLYHSETIESV